ncbi:phage tail family protein [Jeotgalibaca porci]|uniref:phage tail family protein n=1 Tax=Jeotgalibaca porci TaxID=1868793 RepID=UPI0035A005D4
MEKIIYTNADKEVVQLSVDPPFLLQSKEGFSSVDNEITSDSVYGQDGKQYIDAKLSVRNLFITGMLLGENKESYFELRRSLIKAFNPKLAGTLTYTNNFGTYQIDVMPELAPSFNESDGGSYYKAFDISLQALDPYWTDKSEIDAEIPMARIEPMLTFPLEITPDFEFAQLIAGDVIEIHNNGDVAVGAVFTINVGGPLVNPRLYNVLTQEYFALNGTFVTGTKLRISTLRGKKRVEQDDGSGWYNIMTKRKVESKFLQLEKGINYLQLQADSGVAFTTSYIRFEPKILGV